MEKNNRVLLGMSGGVDSSVSALLLKNQGYEVVGLTMDLYQENSNKNEAIDENEDKFIDAKNVAKQLDVEHYVYDLKPQFQNRVIDNFIDCYANCKTPNPCIECNRYMKFGAMFDFGKEHNCEYIATGHYARTEYSEKYGRVVIKKSDAKSKDQTYVLWNVPKEVVSHMVFPLASYENKDQIREIAKENGLQVANKPDSEDICFIPDGDYKKFLINHSNIKPKQGNIVLKDGTVVGKHNGLYNYTIGQRRGLGVSYKVPLFVLGFNSLKNEVIVGEEKELYQTEVLVTNINLLAVDEIKDWMDVEVKTRYSVKQAKAKIKQENKLIKIIFDEPQRAITPGQSAVFYDDDIVIGGGKII